MPIFKPFRGIRPQDDYFEIFPTYPFDNFSKEEILDKSQVENSYVQMVKPYLFSKSKDLDRTLRKIRHNYEELLEKNVLTQDPSSFYLYEQQHPNGEAFRGLLGLSSLEDFWNGKIKRHESTIPQKKEEFSKYLEKVNLQSDPILLTYPSNSKVELLMDLEQKNIPIIRYTDDRNVTHKIWKIDNRLKIKQLKDTIEGIDSFYIADGHHRIGSTALNAKRLKEKNKKHTGLEPYNFIYSFMVSSHSIKINDHNRIIKKLEGISKTEFLKELEKSFLIHEKGENPYFPSKKFHISMYLDGSFYSLHLKHELRTENNGSILQDHLLLDQLVLKNILKIEDTDSSDNIKYVKGDASKEGIVKMQKIIDENGYDIGFGVYPISFKELMKISDEKIIMPPKCTHIEPKLITALLMYDMK